MKEKFARHIIEGTGPDALEAALKFYGETEKKARAVLDNLESLSSEEILASLSLFPAETQARILLYLALRGEPVKERAMDMAGYLDGEGPDAAAVRRILGLEEPQGTERYLRYLRKNYIPYALNPCRLYAASSWKLLSQGWDKEVFSRALSYLRRCSDDFVRTPYVLSLMEAAGERMAEVLEEVLDFQRAMLFDPERVKILVKAAEVLKDAGLLDEGSSEKILLAVREIETKAFRFWALKEIARTMAEAGLRERAKEISRSIENPFWKGATAFELLREGERAEDLEDPFWKLMVDLKTHPQEQDRIVEEFMENPYIPDGIKLPSLEIVLPLLKSPEKVEAFLKEKGRRPGEGKEEPQRSLEAEITTEEFLEMPVAERNEEAKRLAESVELQQENFPFFREVLYHPEAVDILLARKAKGEGRDQASRILQILREF